LLCRTALGASRPFGCAPTDQNDELVPYRGGQRPVSVEIFAATMRPLALSAARLERNVAGPGSQTSPIGHGSSENNRNLGVLTCSCGQWRAVDVVGSGHSHRAIA